MHGLTNTTTLRKLCIHIILTESKEERVIVTVVSQEPKIHIHNENFTDPSIQVSNVAGDALRPLDSPHQSKDNLTKTSGSCSPERMCRTKPISW